MKNLVTETLSEYLFEIEVIKDAKDTGIKAEDVDSKEFLVGIEVEKEHSSDLAVRKLLSLQNLANNPKYYSEGMRKGIFNDPGAINLYKKYFIDKEELESTIPDAESKSLGI